MKVFGNPWFLLVCGIIALTAYGYFGSPLEMAAIGLPFFVVIVGSAMLARYARPRATQPAAGFGLGASIYLALIGAAVVYVIWSGINGNGVVGWLDAIQARRDGKFDEKLSIITAMFYVLIPAVLLAVPLSRIGAGRKTQAAALAPGKAPRNQRRVMLSTGAGLLIATWIIGFGIYEYYNLRNAREMQASYAPVDVAAPVGAAANLEFVALRGRVHPLGTLVLRREHSSDGTYFIPLVSPSGRDSDPQVHWVVQLDSSHVPPLPIPVRAHALGDTLPQTTSEAFARMGVHLAPDVVLASYVATSTAGQVLDASQNNWLYFMIGAGTTSLVIVMVLFITWLKLPRTPPMRR